MGGCVGGDTSILENILSTLGEQGEWCSVYEGFQHKLKAFSNYIPT